VYVFDNLPAHPRPDTKYNCTIYEYNFFYDYTGRCGYWAPYVSRGSRTVFQGAQNGEVSTINMFTGEDRSNKIMVTFDSPCFRELADSFSITVTESQYGGATGGGGGTSGGGAGRN
jgi:hypothetical protein